MKRFLSLIAIQIFFLNAILSANSSAKWTKTELILDNGIVQQIIKLPSGSGNLITTFYKPVDGEFKYFQSENTDFQFEIDGTIHSGKGNWDLGGVTSITDPLQGNGAAVTMVSADRKVEVTLKYLLYLNLPLIRKSLVVKNLTEEEINLESIDVEKFNVTGYGTTTFSWIYSNYGRRKSIGPHEGNLQDALLIVLRIEWLTS